MTGFRNDTRFVVEVRESLDLSAMVNSYPAVVRPGIIRQARDASARGKKSGDRPPSPAEADIWSHVHTRGNGSSRGIQETNQSR